MGNIQRLNDSNSAGGAINSIAQNTVFANNKLVSVNGSTGTSDSSCPTSPHCAGEWQTANGSNNVFIGNIPVNHTTNSDTCGHTRVNGSSNIFVNGS